MNIDHENAYDLTRWRHADDTVRGGDRTSAPTNGRRVCSRAAAHRSGSVRRRAERSSPALSARLPACVAPDGRLTSQAASPDPRFFRCVAVWRDKADIFTHFHRSHTDELQHEIQSKWKRRRSKRMFIGYVCRKY